MDTIVDYLVHDHDSGTRESSNSAQEKKEEEKPSFAKASAGEEKDEKAITNKMLAMDF